MSLKDILLHITRSPAVIHDSSEENQIIEECYITLSESVGMQLVSIANSAMLIDGWDDIKFTNHNNIFSAISVEIVESKNIKDSNLTLYNDLIQFLFSNFFNYIDGPRGIIHQDHKSIKSKLVWLELFDQKAYCIMFPEKVDKSLILLNPSNPEWVNVLYILYLMWSPIVDKFLECIFEISNFPEINSYIKSLNEEQLEEKMEHDHIEYVFE